MTASLPKIGNVEPKCPYCGFAIDKKPAQKNKCPNCGKYIFVLTSPEDKEKVIEIQRDRLHLQEKFDKLESNPEYRQEKGRLAKKWGKEPAPNDILWSLANQHLYLHARNGNWELYRWTKLDMARILQEEIKLKAALQVYLEICYLDINGPFNVGGITSPKLLKENPPFRPERGSLWPAILNSVRDLTDYLDLQPEQIKEMFLSIAESNHKNLKLPVLPAKAWDLLNKELEHSGQHVKRYISNTEEATMNNFITLACPSCGGKLEVTSNADQLVCGFCGQRHIVKREGGTLSLAPVMEAMNQVKTGVDRTNAELAIVRLEKEINKLTNERSVLLGSHPRPIAKVSGFIVPVSAIVVGALIDFGFICNIMANGFSKSLPGLIFGTVIIGVGVLLMWLRKSPVKSWEKNIGPRIKALDNQITKDSQELQRYKKFVSS